MPISPPLSNKGELIQHNLHHLVHHNSNTHYPQEQYDEGVRLHSQYGSPTSTPDNNYGYRGQQQSIYGYQHQYQDPSIGMQYVSFWNCIVYALANTEAGWLRCNVPNAGISGSLQHTCYLPPITIDEHDRYITNKKWSWNSQSTALAAANVRKFI